MKLRFREYHRRSFVPLTTLALAAYYILVFLPLQRHARRLQQGREGRTAEEAKNNLAAAIQLVLEDRHRRGFKAQ